MVETQSIFAYKTHATHIAMQPNENPFNDTRSQKINEDICFVYSFDFFIAFNSTDAWVKTRFSRHFAAKLIKLRS